MLTLIQDDYDNDHEYKLAKRCYDSSCDFYYNSEGYNYYVGSCQPLIPPSPH